MPTSAESQTLSFQTEVKQLLNLVANALYSNKEIFLRELISNASDAAEKLRYEALTDNALYGNDSELKIWVSFDKDANTVTIRDNGIGMSREEVIENLGTIAKSGTQAFKDMLEAGKSKDAALIGQFGVGFYSAFVVADKVVVKTLRAGMQESQGVVWQSDGQGEYTIENSERSQRGTEIILHLKEEAKEFLDGTRLRTVIAKYSDHIMLPIMMQKIEPPKAAKDGEEAADETVILEDEVVNSAKALWALPKSQIKAEEYNALYKHIAHDFEDPLAWAHNRVEGKLEYTSLLYIPARAPFDLYHPEARRGLKLYVKRVFIMDDAEHFMPMYLRFVKGIIDSNDLPLNISREILQSNRVIDKIRSACVKRILTTLEDMAENDKEKYAKFWEQFGSVIKEGPAEDFANKDRVAKLLRFSSTHTDQATQDVALTDYVSRMKPEQKHIYYLTADNFTAAQNSPLLEMFRKKGIEVLLLSDRVDEWLTSHLQEFEGKSLQSISKGELDLGDMEDPEVKEQQEKQQQAFSEVVKKIKTALGEERVKDVRITHRLTDSPACVVFDDNELSGHMQRLLQSAGQEFAASKPILELNPEHPINERLRSVADDEKLKRWSGILLNQALLAEGEQLKNPAGFVKDLNQLLIELT
ncbi:MAG: molecular chaperone HtpG [Gammaproteobacteria bacterium]|nr:molecular chaperone HtpG [Gammaproteobacteria bacterium]